MEQYRPVMIVHPSAANSSVRKALRAAGYTVVTSEHPELFKVLDVIPVGLSSVILNAALASIREHSCASVRANFGGRVAEALSTVVAP